MRDTADDGSVSLTTVTLSDVLVSSYHFGGAEGDTVVDTVTLNFSQASVSRTGVTGSDSR